MSIKIPFEILKKIASFTTRKEASICAYVCKAWSMPFQASLWEKISILRDVELNILLQKLVENPEMYLHTGSYVQVLDLGSRDSLSDITIDKLQKYFPDLKILKIEKGLWYRTHLTKRSDWSLWESLRHLTTCIPHCPNEDNFQELQRMLNGLPLLQTLVIKNKSPGSTSSIGWKTLEAIHSVLPNLEYLNLQSQMFRIPETDMVQIKAVLPATSLNTVKFDIENMSLEWFFYCAIKYKNIHTFQWRDSKSVGKDSSEAHSTYLEPTNNILLGKISAFLELPYFFPRLENFSLGENPAVAWRGVTLWQIFEELSFPLKRLGLTIGIDDFLPFTAARIIRECSEACSKSLETFHIKAVMHKPNSAQIPRIFQAVPISYRRLIDLSVKAKYSIIELDDILNNCPVLKKLSISADTILLSSVVSDNNTSHFLEQIELAKSKVKSCVFNHLSLRCANLAHMRLSKLTVLGLISQDTGNLCLDMSNTCFKDLEIDQVVFYSMEDTNLDEYRHRNLKINIISIEQTSCARIQNNDNLSKGMLSGYTSKYTSGDTLWFHCFNPPKTASEVVVLQALSKEEVEYAKQYFMAYRHKSRGQLPHPSILCNDYGLVDSWYWSNDLHRGYVTLIYK